MNMFSATGNLGKDCRVAQVGNGTVCNFTLAVKSGYGDKAQTLWIDCAVWGRQAEGQLPAYLLKGQQVAVSGELGQREHDGKNYLTMRVMNCDLIGGKPEGQLSPQSNGQPLTSHQVKGPQGVNQNQAQHGLPPHQPMENPDFDFDDDIPF